MAATRRKAAVAKTVVKQSNVAGPTAITAKLGNVGIEDAKRVAEAERLNNLAASVDVAEKKIPGIGGFVNAPKVLPSKDGRSYAGNASRLMNALYDATETPTLYLLPGWERIALVMSKACERLEKAGWRRGR